MSRKYQTDKTLAATRMMVEQVRRITHPNLCPLELVAAVALDLQEIEDSVIGNRQVFDSTPMATLFEAAVRWADETLTRHAMQQVGAHG